MSNFMIGRRRAGIKYEYDGDGRFDQERWNSVDKRYWTRWLRRLRKEETEEEIEDYEDVRNFGGDVCPDDLRGDHHDLQGGAEAPS